MANYTPHKTSRKATYYTNKRHPLHMLQNTKLFENLLNVNRSFAERLVNAIKKIAANLRNFFKENPLEAKTEYGQALLEAMNKVENRVQELWDEAVAQGIRAEKSESNNNIWYSDRTSFAEQVDKAQTSSWNNRNALFVSDTPDILLDLGLKQLPVLYTKAHLMEALKPKSNNNSHWHGLTSEQVKLMPEILKSPAIIMDSLSTSDDIVVISDYLDNDGAPIVAVIHPNGQGIYELQTQPSNFVKSYYGKDKGFESYIKRALTNDKILYISKEKSQSLYRQIGLQLPNGFNKLGFNKIIRQSNSIVNTLSQQNSDRFDADYLSAVERGNMATAQKMVDEAAGYTSPKLYHGTKNFGFTEFDLVLKTKP